MHQWWRIAYVVFLVGRSHDHANGFPTGIATDFVKELGIFVQRDGLPQRVADSVRLPTGYQNL